MRGQKITAAIVGHAGQQQPGLTPGEHLMLIEQHCKTQAPDFFNPFNHTGIVFVIAGHKKIPRGRLNPGQRRHIIAELID